MLQGPAPSVEGSHYDVPPRVLSPGNVRDRSENTAAATNLSAMCDNAGVVLVCMRKPLVIRDITVQCRT
jgi:hypothetical protein